MEHSLEKIISKPSDYKICTSCGNLNWYENEECIICGDDLELSELMDNEMMDDWFEEEKEFWMNVEDYTEEEVYGVIREV
jgi:hypothetical protein